MPDVSVLWCPSLSMCHLILQGFSIRPGLIKTWLYLFFHCSCFSRGSASKLKAKFRPGSVLVKADIGFIHIQGVGRIDFAFWWGCGKATLQKNRLEGKYCYIQFGKYLPQTTLEQLNVWRERIIHLIDFLHTPIRMHTLPKWPRLSSCLQGVSILAGDERIVVYQSVLCNKTNPRLDTT